MECFTLLFFLYSCLRMALADLCWREIPPFWQAAAACCLLTARLLAPGAVPFQFPLLLLFALPLILLSTARLWGGADCKWGILQLFWQGPFETFLTLGLSCLVLLPVFLFPKLRKRRKNTLFFPSAPAGDSSPDEARCTSTPTPTLPLLVPWILLAWLRQGMFLFR